LPTQVFVRGWSVFGETTAITRERAYEIIDQIKAQLEVETHRLIINCFVFEPIQRIVANVLEAPTVGTRVRDMIQQVLSANIIKAEGKDLQAVVQKSPDIRRRNGELAEKQKEITEYFSKGNDEVRPVWSGHCLKGPGGAVLGRFNDAGAWKWAPVNISKSLKVEEQKVKDFLDMQTTDW
jgi:hypothetical protein